MRVLSLALLTLLAPACATTHDVTSDDAGTGIDAFRMAGDAAPDAFIVPVDAFVVRTDAFVSPIDAFVSPFDAFVSPIDAWAPPFDAAGLTRTGYIVVEQSDLFSGPFLIAAFGPTSPADLMRGLYGPGCSIVETSGSCSVITCTTPWTTDLAGTVALQSGSVLLSASTPMPSGGTPSDTFYSAMGSDPIAAGQPVDLSVTGATVPALSGRVTMPPPSDGVLTTTVSRSTDYVYSWTATGAGRTWVGIELQSGAEAPFIQCIAPASARSITIPHALISRFTVGDTVIAYAANDDSVDVAAPPYLVELSAWSFTEITTNVTP